MEDNKQLNYKFIAMPTQLTLRLDNNLRIMLMTLIQVSTFEQEKSKKKGQKWDGYFKRSNEELKKETGFKSKTLVNATIETLYREKIIDVVCAGKAKGDKQKKNRYKVFIDKFKQYEQDSIYDCLTDVELKINTLDYKSKDFILTYLNKEETIVCDTIIVDDDSSPSEHYNIDNKENTDNLENVDNVKNLENQNNLEMNLFKTSNILNNNKIEDNIKLMIDDFKILSSKKEIESNLNKIFVYITNNYKNLNADAVESYKTMAFNAADKQNQSIS